METSADKENIDLKERNAYLQKQNNYLKECNTYLEKRNAHLESINNANPTEITIIGEDHKVKHVNLAEVNSLGCKSQEEVVGKNVKTVYKDRAEQIIKNNQKVIDTGETQAFEEVMTTAEGKNVKFSIKSPFYENEKVTAVITFSRDITAEKEQEKIAAGKMALIDALDEELRTPLNKAVTVTSVINEASKIKEIFAAIKINHANIHLALSRYDYAERILQLQTGKIFSHKKSVKIKATIEKLIHLLAPEAYQKRLELLINKYGNLPDKITLDKQNYLHVLETLIRNAIRFTDSGNIKIEITLKNDILHTSIYDNGIGVNIEKQDDLFSIFERNVNGTKVSGLRLSGCKSILDILGGTIAVSNNKTRGATFTFTIPVKHGNSDHGVEVINYGPALRLLLVDNDCERSGIQSENFKHHFKTVDNHTVEIALKKDIFTDYDFVFIEHDVDGLEKILTKINSGIRNEPNKNLIVFVFAYPNLNQDMTEILQRFKWLRIATKPILPFEFSENMVDKIHSEDVFKVLVVEDDCINRQAICDKIANISYRIIITEAANGEAALAKIDQKYDLIITDIQMPPGINGIELANRFRDHSLHRDTPIVALTLHKSSLRATTSFNKIIIKPISTEKLQKLFDTYFSNRR